MAKKALHWLRETFPRFSWILAIALLAVIWLSICLFIVYVCFVSAKTPVAFAQKTIEFVFGLIGIRDANGVPVVNRINVQAAMSAYLGLTGVILSVYTLYAHAKKSHSLWRNLPIIKKLAPVAGRDDVRIMKKHYAGASFLTVYSGSFDWIYNEGIFEDIYALAQKAALKMYAFEGDSDIGKIKDRLFSDGKTKFVEEEKINTVLDCLISSNKKEVVRCSIIKKNNACLFLYRKDEMVYTLKEGDFATYLLEAIDILATN